MSNHNFPIFHGIKLAGGGFVENLNVEILSSDPSPVAHGRIWYNSTEKKFKLGTLDATGAVIIRAFATIEAMEALVQEEEDRAMAAEAALQTEIDATQTGAGLGADGSYTADNTTNYISAATSLKDADKKLDTQVKTVADGLAQEIIDRGTAVSGVQSEIDTTQTGAGLGADGTYSPDLTTSYISTATSLKNADKKLDTQVKTVTDGLAQEITDRGTADAAIQSELDATQSGAGLGANGGYTADNTTNYISTAVSLKDADKKLDTQVKTVADNLATETTNRTNADSAIQSELDATQSGAGLGTDGAYVADNTTNYISTAVSLKDADKKIDTQLKSVSDSIAQEIIDRGAADDALDGRLDTIEAAYIKKDGSVAFTGNIDAGSNKIVNVTNPTSAQDAATKDYVDDEVAVLQEQISALGSAFNYVGTIALGTLGATEGAAYDMSTMASTGKDSGDYYKVSSDGWYKVGAEGTAYFAKANDGLVWNTVGGVDKIDSTDSTVSGTTNYISVSGSTDTGFVVDVASDFKTRMSNAESAITQEAIDRANADSAIQSELDATQSGAGLGTDGSYTADNTTNYITTASSLKNADKKLDTQIKVVADDLATETTNRTNADSAIQSELDATQVGAGLGTDGAYTAPAVSNYLGSASSLKDADSKLDTQIKTVADNLASEVTNRTNADTAIQSELDATQVGAGLGTDGAYVADNTTNYLTAASSLKDADKKLDTQIKSLSSEVDTTQVGAGLGTDGSYSADNTTNYLTTASSLKDADKKLDTKLKEVADSAGAVQSELDATQVGAGLGTDGTYSADNTTNYLASASSLKDADKKLDTQLKSVADSLSTFKSDFNARRATFQSSTAGLTHTFAHNLNSTFVDFTVLVEREDGSWRNDVVSVEHYDNNTLKVYLSVSRNVRISATSMASIS